MKEYLLLFWNESGANAYQPDAETLNKAMKDWQTWIGEIAAKGNLVSTKPIQWEGSTISNQGKQSSPAILDKMMVTGYLICKANTTTEIEDWAKRCPILHYPKGFTEIREIAPFEL